MLAWMSAVAAMLWIPVSAHKVFPAYRRSIRSYDGIDGLSAVCPEAMRGDSPIWSDSLRFGVHLFRGRRAHSGVFHILRGAGYDAIYAVATDSAGNIYITVKPHPGLAWSSRWTAGRQIEPECIVSKLSPDGLTVMYTTILSSSGNDSGRAIALGSSGMVYVAGVASARDFPTTQGAFQASSAGGQDAFVACLDGAGRLVFSTYLGGSSDDVATGIAVDASGAVYVSGYTNSMNFPTTAQALSGHTVAALTMPSSRS